ncbi:Nose resistant to fluoxetine protein 6-like Protein [Tribolium castaneum]|uniref:Nose resistant to fluoxetine protein 6-like Protein n=1 Tax=Tribolium castaneum TaxID=7070 RepID=D2A1J8_TRICA|nr:PREDICTED: nose resistant to fluoxetine protein 6 isoform X1 [Tribolium castaneum]EFA01530.2 Nose resistant to fluoxetine protein 6-like Protein [Tribolium castaneum]|eukprot:XP_008192893.2 PREDICTED: nose resistant to fluoxetine protein 6 isoform X1 [Tribolium castaneum]
MKLLTVPIFFSICSFVKCSVNSVTPSISSNEISDNRLNKSQASESNGSEKSRQPVKLNMKQGLLMNQLLAMYTLGEESNQLCKEHSKELNVGLRALEPWALKMFDSSSKLQAGILEGNLFEFGAFQQCIQIYRDTNHGPIRGKFCSLKVKPDMNLLQKILEFRNVSRRRFSKVYQFVSNAALAWSVCIPDSCSTQDVFRHFSKTFYSLSEGLNVTVSLRDKDCVTIFDDKPLSATELSIIVFLLGFIGVVAVASLLHIFYFTSDEASDSKLVSAFSAYANSRRIFSNGPNSDLDCVHGIRVLSTCYVVIGHRYLMLMFFPVVNSLKIMDWVLYYRSTAITGGTLCVDTFFMISGMLVSVGFFSEVKKSHGMNWVLFYLYRYMRITPPLAVVVLCYSTLVHHLGSGPVWHEMLDILQKPCQEYWWATLLHVQNYVHPFPLCMTQAWYLTCDMQYYFLSPLILVPLWKCPVFGYINFVLVYALSIASNFYFAWINRYDGGVPVTNQLFSTHYFQHHYIAPHTRAATYIIGLGVGYTVHKTKGRTIQINYATVASLWMISIATMLASLVGCHTFHEESHDYNRLEAAIFISCSRSAWTFGIVWMVWACIHGYGGPINYVLSSYLFRVLGRISYSIYLLHMLMQYLMSGAAKMPGYFSDFSALYAAFGDLFIMVVIGFAFTVCFELPLIRLVTMALKQGHAKVNPSKE